MKPAKKPNSKLTARQKRELTRRVYALRGKYKGRGLMKSFLTEKDRENVTLTDKNRKL
jgi:hypothetical protein